MALDAAIKATNNLPAPSRIGSFCVAHFSHTKISCYVQCPRKYQFRYVERIEPPSRSIELHLGNVVHLALQKLYADLQNAAPLSESALLQFYDKQWHATFTSAIRIVRARTTAGDYFESGRQMISAYYQRFYPFNQSATIGLEMKLLFPLAESNTFEAKVDRISHSGDNEYEIHDYKTSRRIPSQGQIESDTQLALYEVALRHRWPDAKNVSLVWHYLAHGKEIRDKRTQQQLQIILQQTRQLSRNIEEARSFPARISPLCDWCEYNSICPAVRGKLAP